MCQCLPCHVISREGCQPVRYLNYLDEPCRSGRENEIISVPRAACIDGKVSCKNSERRNNRCYAFEECSYERGCSEGMICRGNKCVCNQKWLRFDPATQKCVERTFGDKCIADEDCDVRSKMNPTWSNLLVCNRKTWTCDCINGTKPSSWSAIDPDTQNYVTRSSCFKNNIIVGLFRGTCFNNPVSGNMDDRTRVCAPGYTCVICPDITTSPFKYHHGECSKFYICSIGTNILCIFFSFINLSRIDRSFTSGRNR